jgi:hypothetical protein
MERTESVIVNAGIERSFLVLSEMTNYALWLDFIDSVEPIDSEGDPVWTLVLKAQLGPFSRMKKLRMAKVLSDHHRLIRFRREEVSGKDVSEWSIDVIFEQLDLNDTQITFKVSYSGKLWSRALETAFNSYVEKARIDLQSYFVSLQTESEDE